jgi:hypothetical protein
MQACRRNTLPLSSEVTPCGFVGRLPTSILKMEAKYYFEVFVSTYKSKRRYNTEQQNHTI